VKSRTIKYKGLDIKMDIDIDNIIKKVSSKYKPEIENYRKLLTKRQEYIHEQHHLLKDKDAFMYMMYDACNISKKIKKVYGINNRQMMVLTFLYNLSMAKVEHINDYLASIACNNIGKVVIDYLIELGYVFKTPVFEYFAITDKGKRIVESAYTALRQDFSYYVKNRKSKRDYIRKKYGTKYTDEERQKRSFLYRKMMMPFWDGGYKVMPKDVALRISYMTQWITQRKSKGLDVDPYYHQLIQKWSKSPDLQKV